MATYETGTATGLSDLLTKLVAFATANGWAASTPTYTLSGTYSQNGTTGLVTVSGLTSGHKFTVGETINVDITSGTAVDGAYVVLTTTTTGLTYQGAASATSGNITISSSHGRVFSKSGLHFSVGHLGNDFVLAGATGYSATAHWLGQAGQSANWPRSNEMEGPYQAYHFFAGTTPDYLHAVIEVSAGLYKHILIGQLVKSGSYTGGEYVCACYWHMAIVNSSTTPNHPNNSYHATPFDTYAQTAPSTNRSIIRADIDSKSNNWMAFKDASIWDGNYAKGSVRAKDGIYDSLHLRSPSEFNQLTPLIPMLICADRPSSMTSPLGYVPDMRSINMTNITPGELLTIGTDEWLCFPLIQKTATWDNASSTTPSSGTYGLAYKRN